MPKKAQAAMEFLMTYGWAILVVLVAVGALAYFGVLSPDNFLPNRCTLPAGVACIDHEATNFLGAGFGEIYVALRNGLGYDMQTVSISVSDCGSATSTSLIKNGDKYAFSATQCSITVGQRYSGQINVTYTNSATSLQHTVKGTLVTKVGGEVI